MENTSRLYTNGTILGAGGLSKKITTPCSESEILYLQTIFTMPGFHGLTVSNIQVGRELIMQQLSALQWHQNIGYVTSDQKSVCTGAHNLVSLINQPIDQDALESFFIDRFYCDFVWIEATQDLLRMNWIYTFEEQLIKYRLDQMIPIIVMSYR